MTAIRRYGLPIITSACAIAAAVLGLLNIPLGAAVAVGGAIIVATLDIAGRVRADAAARAAERRALGRLAEAARTFRSTFAQGMPLGGTAVPDGTPPERLVMMAEQLRGGRFNFNRGRRWSDWYFIGDALTKGRREILAAAALTGGRLPIEEETRVRELAAWMESAAEHAFAISSIYAGYDVTEEPKHSRYMPEDRDLGEINKLDDYMIFATQLTDILSELDRMAALASL